jgi:hypothetical protein
MQAPAQRPALARFQLIGLEVGVKIPNQAAHARLRGAMRVVERIQLMHQPFRMHPAQCVIELG